MADRISLDVLWPSGRTVRVDIVQEPVEAAPDGVDVLEHIEKRVKRRIEVDATALESRASLDDFLEDVTRTEDGPVGAWCFETYWSKLYDVLGIEGSGAEPVRFELNGG